MMKFDLTEFKKERKTFETYNSKIRGGSTTLKKKKHVP